MKCLRWIDLKLILENKPINLNDFLIKLLKRNKILYFVGLLNEKVRNSSEWIELEKRRKAQLKEMAFFAQEAYRVGLRFLIVKTFKLFPYVPDDIDILIFDNNEKFRLLLTRLMKEGGYFIRKIGTPEITLRKIVGNTYVDLDIHFELAAGKYRYFYKNILWTNRRYIRIDGVSIPASSHRDECLVTVAHAVMKEFMITAADVLQLAMCNSSGYISLIDIYKYGMYACWKAAQISMAKLISTNACLPYRINLPLVIWSYIDNLHYRVVKEVNLKPLIELISFPKAKGIKAFFRLFGEEL